MPVCGRQSAEEPELALKYFLLRFHPTNPSSLSAYISSAGPATSLLHHFLPWPVSAFTGILLKIATQGNTFPHSRAGYRLSLGLFC